MDVSSASSHMLYWRLLDVVLLCGSAGVELHHLQKMPTKSWCHDLENSCFLGNALLYFGLHTQYLRKIIFAGLTTTIRRWRCSPIHLTETRLAVQNPHSPEHLVHRPLCVFYLFTDTAAEPNCLPTTGDLKLDSDWRLNWTYTLKPQTPTVILDLVTAVCWMCRYWKWLTKLFRRLSSDIYVIMLTHLYVDTGSW